MSRDRRADRPADRRRRSHQDRASHLGPRRSSVLARRRSDDQSSDTLRRWPSSAASFWWARCDLDLTVPTAIPRCSAISVCVMPSRCCKRTTDCFVVGQVVDRPPYLPHCVEGIQVGWQAHDGRVVPVDLGECACRSARLAPVDVDGGALRDRGQPWCRLAVDVEAVRRLPRIHERLLRGLLREVVTAERPMRDRVDEPAVLAVQRPHGAGFPPPEGVEHGRIHPGNATANTPPGDVAERGVRVLVARVRRRRPISGWLRKS